MKHTHRAYVRFGFLLMGFAVIFGAFGSHVLKELIGEAELNTWDIGIRYHMVHALAIVVLGVTHRHFDEKKLSLALGLFIVGIVIFSGSLYLLATRNIWGNDSFRIIGAITPLGGVSFIAGWLLLFFRGFTPEKDNGGIKRAREGERGRKRSHRPHQKSEEETISEG